jgi:DNA gyrase/topoisomerase IV subunit A
MSLQETDTTELLDRYTYLIKEYVTLAAEIAPKLEKFGKIRQELQSLIVEFNKRGAELKDPEDYKKWVEEELLKRGMSIDGK